METAVITEMEKLERSAKRGTKPGKGRFRRFFKRVYNWSLIDGNAFLESKDWPYLWKK